MRNYITPLSAIFLLSMVGCDLIQKEEDDDGIVSYMLLEEPIPGFNTGVGAFHTASVTISIPPSYSKVQLWADEGGTKAFGVDDQLKLVLTGSAGSKTAILNANTASGSPVGEQSILSNVLTLQEGDYLVEATWENVYAPSGNNASASAAWILVYPEAME